MRTCSESVLKRLFALSNNICSFPNCDIKIVQETGTVTGEISHIKGKYPGSPRYDPNQTEKERDSFDNLLLLCGIHHKIIDRQTDKFTVEALQNMKDEHEQSGNIKLPQDFARLVKYLIDSLNHIKPHIEANNGSQVICDSPGAIQAKNVTINTVKKSIPSIQPPLDSIGASIDMRSYIEYLINRYIDWRKQGPTSDKLLRPFNPSMLHRDIMKKFGARVNLISQNRFADLVIYLQERIDNTIKGKNWRSQSKRNYHTFDEHLGKLRGNTRN